MIQALNKGIMIFYNIKELESQLRANTLPRKHVFIYAIILLTLSSLSALRFSSEGSVDVWSNNIEVLLVAIITIGFTMHLYSLCRKANQEDRFFEYYFSICLIILVRLFVFALILSIPLAIISYLIFPNDVNDYGLFVDLSMTALIGVVYYYFVIRSFERVLMEN